MRGGGLATANLTVASALAITTPDCENMVNGVVVCATDHGECIRVSDLMKFGIGSTVTVSAKNASAIEYFGTLEANKSATISASSEKKTMIFSAAELW